ADRLTQVLFDAAEAIRLAAVLLSPIMPGSSAEILRRVDATPTEPLQLKRDGTWRAEGERVLAQPSPLWPRFDPKKAFKETIVVDSSESTPQPLAVTPSPPAPADPRVTIDVFMKVELRVATIVASQAVPTSKKLLKLQVDLGSEQRSVVAGIAEAY